MSPWNAVPQQNHTFVPVNPKVAITEQPTFHERLPADDERFTGSLYCTMTCLTPTLAGHYRYAARDTVADLRQSVANVIRSICPNVNADTAVQAKTIIEPLTLPGTLANPGAVLISGDAIKSAIIRQPLQSLLNAPMERVTERKIAYRVFSPTDTAMSLCVVTTADYSDPTHPRIQLAKLDANNVYWPRAAVADHLVALAQRSGYPARPHLLSSRTNLPNTNLMRTRNGNPTRILIPAPGDSFSLPGRYLLYHYGGNLDGQFELGRRFNGLGNQYRCLLVGWIQGLQTLEIEPSVIQRFQHTIDYLSDTEMGHLAAHPLLSREDAIELSRQMKSDSAPQNRELRKGELLWVEMSEDKICSFGRWRSYLWKYLDSVLYRENSQTGEKLMRQELGPQESEKIASDKTDFRLTAGRLFHGFVVSGKNHSASDPLTESVGCDLTGLAGRVHVNMAVEVLTEGEQTNRFVGEATQCYCVVGRPVGNAKVSSAEIYLQQKEIDIEGETREMQTWGEFDNDQLSGELAGRKMYPHARCEYSFDRDADCEDVANLVQSLTGQQVPIMRLISNGGVEFLFSIQVENLRRWELGAMLFAISSTRSDVRNFLKSLGCASEDQLSSAIRGYQTRERYEPVLDWIFDENLTFEGGPDFASKIGYQRQRGMGSVELKVDTIEEVLFDGALPACSQFESQKAEHAKAAFYQRVATLVTIDAANEAEKEKKLLEYVGGVLAPWLDARQYRFKSAVSRNYRRDPSGSTLEYHKKVREQHRKNRQRGYR